MRVIAVWLLFCGGCVYAWKNWYHSTLLLVLTMAIIERQDIPKEALGIPGLNPWNLLFVFTLLAFFFRKKEDTPAVGKGATFLIFFYAFVVLLAFIREVGDLQGMVNYAEAVGAKAITRTDIIKDDILNTFKYVVPGLLIFYGCNSETRFREALWALVLMNGVLALLIIKSMGFDALSGGELLEETAIRRIDRDIGYFRSDLAILLAGGTWAIFSFGLTQKNILLKYGLIGLSALCVLAIGLTGGRSGMGVVAVLGFFFGLYKWRIILVMAPIAALILFATVPAVQERMFQGFGYGESKEQELESPEDVDISMVTSGRTEIWPYVIEGIKEDPWFGSGRRSMQRTGLSLNVFDEIGQIFEIGRAHV